MQPHSACTRTTHYYAKAPADERFDFLISVISMISILSCFSILHLFIVLIIHHVLEQHGDQAPQEGPQHCWLHLSLTEGCPELARLQRHTLITVLQCGARYWSQQGGEEEAQGRGGGGAVTGLYYCGYTQRPDQINMQTGMKLTAKMKRIRVIRFIFLLDCQLQSTLHMCLDRHFC